MTEIPSQGEKYFLTCIYRSPSQSRDEFDDFCPKFDLLLSNINQEFQLSLEILMLVAQDRGRMISLTQQVKKSILSHYQLDINKLLINLPIM